jgi:plastocyanin
VPQIPSVDTFGRPSGLNGTKWQYYELSGTQTDFTDSLGRATLLSDPHIENGFEKTSCITCHAFSNIGAPSSARLGDRFPFFAFTDPTVTVPADATLDPESRLPIGNPPASVFFSDAAKTKQKYVQLDFVFSTAFRARRKQSSFQKLDTQHVIHVSEFKYEPKELSIKTGDSVIWVNDGKHSHNATVAGLFNTGMLEPGEQSQPIKFEKANSSGIDYHCTPHPFMKGKIFVAD